MMMTPTECMQSFLSGTWLEDETTIRESAGGEGNISQIPAGPSQQQQAPPSGAVSGGGGETGAEEPETVEPLITPEFAFESTAQNGAALLESMHNDVHAFPRPFDHFLNNLYLNRMPHLYLYDYNRVRLTDKHGKNDYYHASFVDGFNRRYGYIMAQAPFDEETEKGFWRMVVDRKPSMILVFGVVDEKRRSNAPYDISIKGFEKLILSETNSKTFLEHELKAKINGQFWPECNETRTHGKIAITTKSEHSQQDHVKTYDLAIKEGGEGAGVEGRPAVLMHLYEWGKEKEDELPEYMQNMLATIKVQTIRYSQTPGAFTGPVMLVCATGVHKCAYYALLEIVMTRMNELHKVGFRETMATIKTQRFGCFRTEGPYKAIRQMVMNTAIVNGIVHDAAIGPAPKSKHHGNKSTKTPGRGFGKK